MSQAVFSPNLTKKVQWKVAQIANKRCSPVIVYGGLSVNLNHLKTDYNNSWSIVKGRAYWRLLSTKTQVKQCMGTIVFIKMKGM